MNIKLLCVGKLKEDYLKKGINEYAKRLGSYCKFEVVEIVDEKTPDNPSHKALDVILNKEGEKLLAKISPQDTVIALAIEGDLVTSEMIADKLKHYAIHGKSRLVFLIGGSLGLSKAVKQRADYLMSFGRITLPHQLMRVVVSEQIYRAFRIINNQAYHK